MGGHIGGICGGWMRSEAFSPLLPMKHTLSLSYCPHGDGPDDWLLSIKLKSNCLYYQNLHNFTLEFLHF